MQGGANSAKTVEQMTDLFGATGVFNTITSVLLFVVGAISVIMIIIGGLRYVVSGGDSSNITAAKNTVLYAIVGLIVSLLAYAVINFVLTSFTPGGTGGTNV
jgi:multisubunit Na+/H+ antiporter MnhB subunit